MDHTNIGEHIDAAAERRARARSWWGLVATLGPVLVVAMDGSILFLAMPSINESIMPTTDQSLKVIQRVVLKV